MSIFKMVNPTWKKNLQKEGLLYLKLCVFIYQQQTSYAVSKNKENSIYFM
jgi:hypothetical protein